MFSDNRICVWGNVYTAGNKVSITDYFEENTTYYYQYTDNDTGDDAVWSEAYSYKTGNTDDFSVILTGDPQIGASGSSDDYTPDDSSAARDTYNWNLTMQQALKTDSDAVFLLSAGDQINQSGAAKDDDKKTRESEYAGYLYPSVLRSLPVASTIGNHDTAGADYSVHFNNPNAEDNLGATEAGSDYYFSYGDVLFISLNSNNRNQEEHRALMTKAVESNPDAKWKVVIFHSDIYGSGQPHADTDAATNRIIFAPLMDEFDIDVCLTGHDHTYSRSYQIEEDPIKGYGSVKNEEDKDDTYDTYGNTKENGKYANRLRKGYSTLLDKTIYLQLDGDDKTEVPVVQAAEILAAKSAVNTAVDSLEKVEEKNDKTEETTSANSSETAADKQQTTTAAKNAEIVKTGDNSSRTAAAAVAGMTIALGAVLLVTGKREENCETK